MSDQISEIAATVARIEATLEERTQGIIRRLDNLNGSQERQWSAITKNRESVIKIGDKLDNTYEAFEEHSENPGAHGSQTARIEASSNVRVAIITGAASILGAGLTLLVSHLL